MKSQPSGILVLDKPARLSSRQALDRVTSLLPRVKMGHAGTLDPMATGVLVVCVGRATRLIPYVQRMRKEYHATLRLGQRSDTHDLESDVVDVPMAGPIARESFESCVANFRGDIQQVPPQHSAVHVSGRRAYELARAGRAVELEPRAVRIDRLVCTRFEFPNADLEIECSSGTYIRSLVRDIGEQLGCGAVMTRLARTRIGAFRLEDAITPNELTKPHVLESLRPASDAVRELPRVRVRAEQLEEIRHGRAIAASTFEQQLPVGDECALIDSTGQLLGVGQIDVAGGTVRPHIVLIGE
jgi:tRNA pseudouridine55 synthase